MNEKAKKSMVVGKADGNPKFKEMAERVHLKSRKPMAVSNGDAVTEFGNDILDSNRRVAYVYDGEDQLQFEFSTPEDAVKADRLVDFAMDFMERLVFAAQDGVEVFDKPRTRWPSGKRPANEPQIVNPSKKGGEK